MLKPSLGEGCKIRDYRLSKSRAAPPLRYIEHETDEIESAHNQTIQSDTMHVASLGLGDLHRNVSDNSFGVEIGSFGSLKTEYEACLHTS